MNKYTRILAFAAAVIIAAGLCGCKKKLPQDNYEKENAAGTGYGTAMKSSLYIDDFYFLTVGTAKSTVELLAGSAHYHNKNSEFSPVYTLNNGDTIAITYDENQNKVTTAEYTYKETEKTENFFNILVSLGILKSSIQETPGSSTTEIPSGENNGDNSILPPPASNGGTTSDGENNEKPPMQSVTQGAVFAMGMYDVSIVKDSLQVNQPRTEIINSIGKPNYFFSHNFAEDSYIIDCYNLSDGSKLYLDYGYERLNLRCAAIYKNGTYTTVTNSAWNMQTKPAGFTRLSSDSAKIIRLKKNMTPANVYATIGEPSWYEGTRSSYTDVFLLNDGSHAYLNFGSAHNKLTSISIKGADGSITVVSLK